MASDDDDMIVEDLLLETVDTPRAAGKTVISVSVTPPPPPIETSSPRGLPVPPATMKAIGYRPVEESVRGGLSFALNDDDEPSERRKEEVHYSPRRIFFPSIQSPLLPCFPRAIKYSRLSHLSRLRRSPPFRAY
jgi:hypothetical protein